MAVFKAGYGNNGITGKLGNTVFFLDKDKQQCTRAYVANPENPRTTNQQLNRVKTIGVAKFARNIWINRIPNLRLLKKEKGSYYNTIFSSIRANPQIDFVNVGPVYGWAFTEYRTDELSMVMSPTRIWYGLAGITKFRFYNASLFIQDPFSPSWYFGVATETISDLYGSKGKDDQILVITLVNLTQNYTVVREYSQTRIQSKASGTPPQVLYMDILDPQAEDVFVFWAGFIDPVTPRNTPRNTSIQYFCGYLKYMPENPTFNIIEFQLPPNYE